MEEKKGACGTMARGLQVTRRESFAPLRQEWPGLLAQSAADTVFSTWEWQSLWWQHFGQGAQLWLLEVRQGGQLLGVAPLMQAGETMSLVGGVDVSDYLELVVQRGREGEVLEALLAYLQKVPWRALDLHCLPTLCPTLHHLPPLARQQGWRVLLEQENACPALELPHDWESYLARLNKKDRHELRRKLRRLHAAGEVRWYALEEPAHLEGGLQDFFRLHRLSRGDKALFMDQRMEAFFTAIAQALYPKGIFRPYFLELDGVRVASAICFDYRRQAWLYNSGYDPACGHLSAGLLLKAYCIQDAIARGQRRFDFMRGQERYKYELGAQDEPLFHLRIERV